MSSRARLSRLDSDYQSALAHTFLLAQYVSLSGKEQHDLINAMEDRKNALTRAGAEGKTIIIELMGIILDGLKFGNWPWTRGKMEASNESR